jgi:hypothetical protein
MPNKRRCATCKSGCTRSAKLGYRLDQVQLVLLRLASTKFRVSQALRASAMSCRSQPTPGYPSLAARAVRPCGATRGRTIPGSPTTTWQKPDGFVRFLSPANRHARAGQPDTQRGGSCPASAPPLGRSDWLRRCPHDAQPRGVASSTSWATLAPYESFQSSDTDVISHESGW